MSDWALGKKLNSRIADVPLNHLIWLNDYKAYGKDSYVFRNKDILYELYRSPIAINDAIVWAEALDYIFAQNNNVGVALGEIYGIDSTVNWSELYTLKEIANNETAFSIIMNNETLFNTGVNSENFMNAVFASQVALSTMYDNYLQTTSVLIKSPYLLSAAQASPYYEVTESTEPISKAESGSRRIHYNNKCFIVGASQVCDSLSSASTYVNTLNGLALDQAEDTYGTNALTWRINKFAETANIQPAFRGSSYSDDNTKSSYMAYVKIE